MKLFQKAKFLFLTPKVEESQWLMQHTHRGPEVVTTISEAFRNKIFEKKVSDQIFVRVFVYIVTIMFYSILLFELPHLHIL